MAEPVPVTGQAAAAAHPVGWREALRAWHVELRRADAALAGLRAREARVATLSAELRAEHAALMRRVPRLVATMARMREVLQRFRDLVDRVRGGLGGLGGLGGALAATPVLPIAGLVAATAVLAAFVTDYVRFARRMDAYERLIREGRTPEEAAAVVDRLVPPRAPATVFDLNIGGMPLWVIVALGVGAWFVLGRR